MAKFSIYKYVRTGKGWRYCKAVFHPNGKIKPNIVVVSGVEEKHTEGRYFLICSNHQSLTAWPLVGKARFATKCITSGLPSNIKDERTRVVL